VELVFGRIGKADAVAMLPQTMSGFVERDAVVLSSLLKIRLSLAPVVSHA